MNTAPICGQPIFPGVSEYICTKQQGHEGEHNWVIGEAFANKFCGLPSLLVPPRSMYQFLAERRMYSLDETGQVDLQASAKNADELQALWLVVRAEALEEAARTAEQWMNERWMGSCADAIRHLQLGQAVTPSASKNP